MVYFKFHGKNYSESSKLTYSKLNPSRENHVHFISCKPLHKNHPRECFGTKLWFMQIATSVVEKTQISSVAFHLSTTVYMKILWCPETTLSGFLLLMKKFPCLDRCSRLWHSFPLISSPTMITIVIISLDLWPLFIQAFLFECMKYILNIVHSIIGSNESHFHFLSQFSSTLPSPT